MADLRRRGATTVEYALLLLLIVLACVIAVGTLGSNVSGLFTGVIPPVTPGDPPVAATAESDPAGPPTASGKSKKPKKPKRPHAQGQPAQGNASGR
jgi:Flp pilus assembly pilin Flp